MSEQEKINVNIFPFTSPKWRQTWIKIQGSNIETGCFVPKRYWISWRWNGWQYWWDKGLHWMYVGERNGTDKGEFTYNERKFYQC